MWRSVSRNVSLCSFSGEMYRNFACPALQRYPEFVLGACQSGVQAHGAYAAPRQIVDLVGHERNQWGDHDRQSR